MTANSEVASRTTKRRIELERQLAQVAQQERELKVQQAVSADPAYSKLEEQSRTIADQLHRKRVVVKRKEFAITVRQRRLTNIPKEIRRISAEKREVETEVARLESQQEQLEARLSEIRNKLATRIERDIAIPA